MNLRALGSSDWKVRQRAVEGLVSSDKLEDEQLVSELIQVVATSEQDLGRFNSALQALAHFAPDVVVPRLHVLVGHPSTEVRVACGVLLTQLNSGLGAPAVLRLLGDPEPNVVWQALEAVGETRLRQATPRVLELALDGEYALAFAAIGVLGRMQDASLALKLADFLANPQVAPAAAEALGQIGHVVAVPALLQWLERDTAAVDPCIAALCTLAQQAGEAEVHRLVSQFLGPNGTRRLIQRASLQTRGRNTAQLAKVLGWLLPGPQEAAIVPALLTLCEHPRARQEAEIALRHCSLRAFEALASTVDADKPECRLIAIVSLGRLQDARALPLFERLLAEGDAEAALGAARALGDLKEPSALPIFLSHLNHADASVGQALLESGSYLAEHHRPALLDMLCSPAARTRLAAVHWLAGQSDPAVIRALTTSLEDPDRRVRLQALYALGPSIGDDHGLLKAIERCFDAGPNSLRAAAVSLLHAFRGPESERMVLHALQENDIWAPVQACRCLASWADSRFLATLQPVLESYLPPVRAEAALAWGRMGGAPGRLQGLLQAPEQEVRLAALRGIAANPTDEGARILVSHPDAAEVLEAGSHCPHPEVVRWLLSQVRATSHPAAVVAALGLNPHPSARAALVDMLEGTLGRHALQVLAARPDALSSPLPALSQADPLPIDSLEVLARAGAWPTLQALHSNPSLQDGVLLVLGAHGQWAALRNLTGPEPASKTAQALLGLAP